MSNVPVCLVGCGGMGHRHILGFAALAATGLSNLDLVAVCDRDRSRAEGAANEAERVLGRRPRIHADIADAVADPAIAAFDVVTDVASHVPVVLPALEARRPVLCEKPLGLTMRACRAMLDAAARTGTLLATAENFRRDPPNRLARAAIHAGLLGHVHLMTQISVGGDDRIMITPWRHLREHGAVALDVGVHYTDLIQYYLGPIVSMYGHGFIAEPVRRGGAGALEPHPAYRHQGMALPERIEATAEDSVVATLGLRSGALVQLSYVPSGPGRAWYQRSVHGRLGSLEVPRDRTGGAPVLRRRGGELAGRELMRAVPDFALDEVTARLFGAEGVAYDLPFVEADARHIAIELHDFGEAVRHGRRAEVDGQDGMTAVAALLGIFESGRLGRAVTMEEMLAGTVTGLQDDLDRRLGLLR